MAVLWVTRHPYKGIYHDARLYLIQAINSINHQFDADLYLAYGSQDQFTLFSWIYRPLIFLFDPIIAHNVLLLAGQSAWFVAALYFTRTFFGSWKAAIASILGILVLYPYYDGSHVFRYAENFTTPRIFAEAWVLFSLAAAHRNRMGLASVGLAVAAILHPLIALPGCAIVALLASLRHRALWAVYSFFFLAGLVLAWLGIEPFARGLVTFDNPWFESVYQHSSFGFISRWPCLGFIAPLSGFAVLLMASTVADNSQRRLIGAVCTVALAGVVVSVIGGDIARNVLIVDLQPWRALWLLIFLSNAWAVVVALRLPSSWLSRKLIYLAVAGQAISMVLEAPVPIPSSIFILAALALFCERRSGEPLHGALAMALYMIAAILIGLTIFALSTTLLSRIGIPGSMKFVLNVIVTSTVLIMLILSIKRTAPPSAAQLGILVVGAIIALTLVDRRDSWRKFVEDANVSEDLNAFLGDVRSVYWEGGLELLWFKLARPSYYSCPQGAGAIMFRGNAMEFRRRSDGIAGLNTRDFAHNEFIVCAPKRQLEEDGPRSRDQLESACNDLPELDAVVLTTLVPSAQHTVWHAPAPQVVSRRKVQYFDMFYLYRCSDFR